MPASWLNVDVAGLAELKEDVEPAKLTHAREELLVALRACRNTIKIAFRYGCLANATPRPPIPHTSPQPPPSSPTIVPALIPGTTALPT